MKRVYLIYVIFIISLLFVCCDQQHRDGVIPQPLAMEFGGGYYAIDESMVVYADSQFVDMAADVIMQRFDIEVESTENRADANLSFVFDELIADQGYKLSVSSGGVEILASSRKGCFYAIQTLKQLNGMGKQLRFPNVEIVDEPRFEYRGLMLDVSRFFIPKETVLTIIDAASMLKINKLHLHLVDDNGWRLEIKRYPKLTEVGAWRVERDEQFPMRPNAKRGEEATVGGF